VISIAGIFFFLQYAEKKKPTTTVWEKLCKVDWIGPVFFIPAVVCLIFALELGGTALPWTSPLVLALFAVAGVLGPVWVYSQWKLGEKATIPGRIFVQRTVLFGSIYSFLIGATTVIVNFYVPLYFQAVRDSGPTQSGIQTLPYIISVIVSAIVGGIGISLVGYILPFMVVGTTIHAVGMGLLSRLGPDTPSWQWITFESLAGFGVGINLQVYRLTHRFNIRRPSSQCKPCSSYVTSPSQLP
jgi:hypothetical protein